MQAPLAGALRGERLVGRPCCHLQNQGLQARGFSFTHSAGSRSGELPCRVFQGHIVGRDLDRRPTSQGSADLALFGFRVPGFHVLAVVAAGGLQCVLLGVLSGRLGRRFGRAAGLRDSTRERRNRQGRNPQLTSTVQLTAQREPRTLKREFTESRGIDINRTRNRSNCSVFTDHAAREGGGGGARADPKAAERGSR